MLSIQYVYIKNNNGLIQTVISNPTSTDFNFYEYVSNEKTHGRRRWFLVGSVTQWPQMRDKPWL